MAGPRVPVTDTPRAPALTDTPVWTLASLAGRDTRLRTSPNATTRVNGAPVCTDVLSPPPPPATTRPSPALTQFGSGTCVQRDRSGGPSRCRSAASRIPGCRGRPLPHPHTLGWLFSHIPESASSPGLDASKVTHTPMFTVRCKFKGLWQTQARVQQCGIRVPRRPCTAHPPLSLPGSSGHRRPEAFQTGFFRSATLSNTHRRFHYAFWRPASPFPCSAE